MMGRMKNGLLKEILDLCLGGSGVSQDVGGEGGS